MNKDIIEFEDYGITIDTNEIKNMSREELLKCKAKIKEIEEILDKKKM